MILTILVFVIVLSVLIFVHEFGHFITAKKSGMKVEEFGFGFPPRIWGIKKGETMYSINSIPFGGFVKILGETGEEKNNPKSFAGKSASKRAIVIAAGVVMNLLLALVLLIIVNMAGLKAGFPEDQIPAEARNLSVQITQIADGSPAFNAGLKIFDQIKKLSVDGTNVAIEKVTQVQEIVNANRGKNVLINIQRGNDDLNIIVTPRLNPPEGEGALGISLSVTGTVRYPLYKAIYHGTVDTWFILSRTAAGYAEIIKNLFSTGKAGVVLTGPVGIAVITGQAAQQGLAYVLQFMALISINLAVLNFIPFPALDGGRLLFILIEKLRGRPISRKIENAVNSFGFALLILLMLYVTTKDVLKFF